MIAMSGCAAVFIHRDLTVVEKLRQESSGLARATTSSKEAFSWIQDHTQTIPAVYLSPDADFSTFDFLDEIWKERPALPVWIIEETISSQNECSTRIMEKTAVTGFIPAISASMMAAYQGLRRKKTSFEQETPGFIAIPVMDFLLHPHFPFDVYFRVADSSMRIFGEKGMKIDLKQIEQLCEKLDFLHVKNEVIRERSRLLQETCAGMLENPDFPDNWKTAEVLARSKNLLNRIRTSEIGNPMVNLARNLLEDLQKLIANLKPDTGSLSRLIDRSLSNDRAIYCSTLSILLCQQLKFEKKATLEILGIAAILQDISLYQTPSGDLSGKAPDEMNAEEARYHQRHPILSTDILAHHTTIPQVTLQVIRQHHERKDRTGFPNRIGGVQLHPLAEILSLINCCFDVSHRYLNQKAALFELESEVFVHFSESSVLALKKIHSRL
jgi:response regulator RpfG family c-di-GMP phosphodiesterase